MDKTNATYIPIELGGGSGTADGHWDEITWGSNFTGITDGNGNDMRNELMGGWLNQPTFVSNMTIMSFADIGYTVAPIPIPASFILFASGITGLFGFKRFKNLDLKRVKMSMKFLRYYLFLIYFHSTFFGCCFLSRY